MSVGDALGKRSQAGLTVAQVSQLTCIRKRSSGESSEAISPPAAVTSTPGDTSRLARVVGLDPEELVREYDAVHGAPNAITAADVFEPSTPIKLKERRRANWSVVMVVVLALVLGYGVFRLVDHGSSPRPVASSGTHSAASKSPTAKPSPTPAAAHPATIHQDCWIQFAGRMASPCSRSTC